LAYSDTTIWSTRDSRRCRFPHDLRLECPGPVYGHLDLDLTGGLGQHRLGPGAVADVAGLRVRLAVFLMAQVLAQLLVRRRLQHR
jgi:hypothetical protein